MQGIFLKIRYFERGLSKTHKKVTLLFLSNPVPFRTKLSQKGSAIKEQLLFRLRNKFRKIYFLVMYYLTKFDGVI